MYEMVVHRRCSDMPRQVSLKSCRDVLVRMSVEASWHYCSVDKS